MKVPSLRFSTKKVFNNHLMNHYHLNREGRLPVPKNDNRRQYTYLDGTTMESTTWSFFVDSEGSEDSIVPCFRVININHSCEYSIDNIPFLLSPKLSVISNWLQSEIKFSWSVMILYAIPIHVCGMGAGFPTGPSSAPTTGCLTIQLSLDTIYPEIPQIEGSVPQGCPLLQMPITMAINQSFPQSFLWIPSQISGNQLTH